MELQDLPLHNEGVSSELWHALYSWHRTQKKNGLSFIITMDVIICVSAALFTWCNVSCTNDCGQKIMTVCILKKGAILCGCGSIVCLFFLSFQFSFVLLFSAHLLPGLWIGLPTLDLFACVLQPRLRQLSISLVFLFVLINHWTVFALPQVSAFGSWLWQKQKC